MTYLRHLTLRGVQRLALIDLLEITSQLHDLEALRLINTRVTGTMLVRELV